LKSVSLLLLIAIVFGAAAMWQSRRVSALEEERARAMAIQSGEIADTASGEVRAGWGVVTIGRPSGMSTDASPIDDEAPAEVDFEDVGELDDEAELLSADPSWLGDYELDVAPGHTLTSIATTHYGAASTELVEALARYNGLSDASALAVGQRLKLPPLDVLMR